MAGAPRLRLLGVPQLLAADGGVRLLERRDAALLALLALQGPMPRATVAAWLWPDRTDALARANLRQHLFKLKRGAGLALVDGDQRIGLATGIDHDLHPAEGAGGELLAGLRYDDLPALDDWLGPARQRWQRLTWQALCDRADRAEQDRRWDEALVLARRMTEIAPASEAAHRRLARVHYLRGDTAAARQALAAAGEARAETDTETDTDTDTDTETETASLARLLDAAEASPEGAGWARGPLPPALLRTPQVVGRDDALAALQRAVSRQRVPVLIGEAGVGKSRRWTSGWACSCSMPTATNWPACSRPWGHRRPGARRRRASGWRWGLRGRRPLRATASPCWSTTCRLHARPRRPAG